MIEIRTAGPKGLGIFAARRIPRGTRILSERPLFGITSAQGPSAVYSEFRRLSAEQRARVLRLSAVRNREIGLTRWMHTLLYTIAGRGAWPTIRHLREHNRVLNVFRTNSFSLNSASVYEQAVFPGIARLNHACVPNAQGNFDDEGGQMNVHAVRDIGDQEEVTISYFYDQGMMREQRKEWLKTYGFQCGCAICDQDNPKSEESDRRRWQLRQAMKALADRTARPAIEEETLLSLEIARTMLRFFQEEKIAGREVASVHLEAAKLCEQRGDHTGAFRYAQAALSMDQLILGQDHQLYRNSLKVFERIKGVQRRDSLAVEDGREVLPLAKAAAVA